MGCAIPLKKQNEETDFCFSLSGAGLNSSEAINVLTSQDCSDRSLHSLRLTNTLKVYPQSTKNWGVSVQRTFKTRILSLRIQAPKLNAFSTRLRKANISKDIKLPNCCHLHSLTCGTYFWFSFFFLISTPT